MSADQRVVRSIGALYSQPRISQKRRVCDGHLTVGHYIEPGEQVIFSALPPNDPEIGNDGWWHHAYCAECAPLTDEESA